VVAPCRFLSADLAVLRIEVPASLSTRISVASPPDQCVAEHRFSGRDGHTVRGGHGREITGRWGQRARRPRGGNVRRNAGPSRAHRLPHGPAFECERPPRQEPDDEHATTGAPRFLRRARTKRRVTQGSVIAVASQRSTATRNSRCGLDQTQGVLYRKLVAITTRIVLLVALRLLRGDRKCSTTR